MGRSNQILINDETFNVMFVSDPIEGQIQGTPVVTEGKFAGEYIFVTHNTNVDSTVQTPVGHFSVLEVGKDGISIFTESVLDVEPTNVVPYGPLGAAFNPTSGKYDGGRFNLNDIVVWTSAADNGRGGVGFTRASSDQKNEKENKEKIQSDGG